ncbi:CPBP family intramembrane glutamic endopeptidase [Paenibacillus contaminans]|jgi:membrane protease YdiL (CAAX protease family)|uniref:CPBP family intramembrane metalloprotease n=1 Tax=Paenibacillus contaminans TaxID=450362 RepID=A0A329MFU8_9BACL|nr:CPBP family intramembrane glutamic endopeptidase [Paenibacillus contaminans]RAV18558.1 CPBP family intramembrane metalloprotease [Paenibacillus contaminans]
MKKWNFFKNIRFQVRDINELDDRFLLANLYLTQALTLVIGLIVFFFQKNKFWEHLSFGEPLKIIGWGLGFAAAFIAVDLLISRFVPEDVADDGGINEKLFGRRPIWHIALISAVVAICEELLFRGAVQHAFGAYWTSILFAAIHIRYLRHWIMTGLVFGVSYGLGWIYEQSGTLWAPIIAHFAIDFVMGCMIRFRREANEKN